jgi:DNA-binding NarL/FixJ family response regulator
MAGARRGADHLHRPTRREQMVNGTLIERDAEPRVRTGVLAVDDQASFRALVRDLVALACDFEVLGEANCGEEAVALAAELQPDLVLMDIRMPGLGGIAAADVIKGRSPETVVVLVSTTAPDDLPDAARRCQADEIVWKTDLRPRLLEDIWRRHRP